ncbi:MAG: prephenate dehydratase [Pseudomonadales bacterium]|uniref:prephenate dehydratase n=1 Tax=Oleiphilus messinensis TaxID=141451 RepID=A0A1Y0IE10_9GAMM|nr:prephenate dehydratase [Oleiphilus messinensis]ARU58510.1 prephenate dehydratase [Oleiphilus messinensis]MCG8613295.1 prephenate dehydratase [Pseudomonadales bacterium]
MIAYQGHQGAYSHLSCQHVFPDREARACSTFIDAMQMVEKGQAELAMIPVENSTAGRVEEIYRLIPKMSLHIVGEHFEPVNHCLLGLPGAQLDALTQVASHPQALAQCAQNIRRLNLYPNATLDTAGAAKELKESGDYHSAAIASSLAAELYGLEILEENFQDISGNTTRFIILSHTQALPAYQEGVSYMTSIIFKVRNIPAALYKALGGFATNGINLVKLESYMPGGTLNSSQFHVDIEGHIEERPLRLAMEELNFFAEDVRLLGTYRAHHFRASVSYHD